MPSHLPTWLPYAIFGALILGYGLVMLAVPKYRNQYRIRPAAGSQPGSDHPGAGSAEVAVLLHYKPMMVYVWLAVGAFPVVLMSLGMAGLPRQQAVLGITPLVSAYLAVAVFAYLRVSRPVQSCYFDERGAVSLIRRDVTIPFDLNHYRYVRMYTSSPGESTTAYPNMLLLSRDTPPSFVTWLSSRLFPVVAEDRVILFFNRWRDADGRYISPDELSARFYRACARAGHPPSKTRGFFANRGWEVGP
jgi:hypothetical protein